MPRPTVTNNALLQVQFQGFHAGQMVMNIMTYTLQECAAPIDMFDVYDEVSTLVSAPAGLFTHWLQCVSSDVVNCSRSFQWIHPTRYAYATYGLGDEIPGQAGAPAMPPNVSAAVTRRTMFSGREEVSTLKIPGVPVGQVLDGYILGAHLLDLGVFADNSVQEIVLGSGAKLVPIPLNREDPGVANALVLAYPHNTVRIMRRRTVGLGK